MSKKEFKEELWYLYGVRLERLISGIRFFIGFRKYFCKGSGAEVSMDFKTANSPYVIGWYHTHPGVKNITASATDNSTMRSWVKAIYKTYLCGIECNGHMACYAYYVGGMTKSKTTIVTKKKVNLYFLGPLFLGVLVE